MAVTLTNLSYAYSDLGDAWRSRELLQRALEVMEREFGADHKQVATVLVNLGIAHGDLGDAEKSCELLETKLGLTPSSYGFVSLLINMLANF